MRTNLSSYIRVATILVAIFVITIPRTHADDLFAGGTGAPDDPYEITNCEELQNIDQVSGDNASFKLMNTIDCSLTDPANQPDGYDGEWSDGEGFLPIGTSNTDGGLSGEFIGSFDGNHKTINGLTINRPDELGVGLFSVLLLSRIENVTLSGGSITGGVYTGSLAGAIEGSAVGGIRAEGMTITGVVDDESPEEFPGVGGLAGLVLFDFEDGLASVEMSSADNTVIGEDDSDFQSAGGLVGVLIGASIKNSYSTSDVSGSTIAGGLVGLLGDSSIVPDVPEDAPTIIDDSYAAGSVGSGEGEAAGGLVGGAITASTAVFHSFSTAAVSGAPEASGGLIGAVEGDEFPVDPTTNYFDMIATGQETCIGGEEVSSCTPVDTGDIGDTTDDTYFLGNHTNPPLDDFDTTVVWSIADGLLPVLQPTFDFDLFTRPEVSNIEADPSGTSALITWTTDGNSTSQVELGPTTDYASSTPVFDEDVPVQEHRVTLTGLLSCTSYHYRVDSVGASSFSSIDNDNTFLTTGCAGGAEVIDSTDVIVPDDASDSNQFILHNNDDLGIEVMVEPGSAGADADFQIKLLDTGAALDELGLPPDTENIGNYIYDLRALTDEKTLIHDFNTPITLILAYGDDDVADIDSSTLQLYRNDGDGWVPLDDCVVDTDAHTVTCTTDQFSIFGLFGSTTTTPPPPTPVHHASSSSSVIYGCKDPKASNYNYFAASDPTLCAYASTTPAVIASTTPAAIPVRDLTIGMQGSDVTALQKLLMTLSSGPAASALSSVGATGYFGLYTQKALAEYQLKNSITPAVGYFGPRTRAQMKLASLTGLWW